MIGIGGMSGMCGNNMGGIGGNYYGWYGVYYVWDWCVRFAHVWVNFIMAWYMGKYFRAIRL